MNEQTIIGWGRKASGNRAISRALIERKGFSLREDGFLRSVDREGPALSFVQDSQGIYYDASVSSDLEGFIAENLTNLQFSRTRNIIKKWRDLRLSKYNGANEYMGVLPDRYVLVVDQVVGDLSIQFGGADNASFAKMLSAALYENQDVTIVLKVHPDMITRGKAGHFDLEKLAALKRIKIISENCHPLRLIEQADAIYTVTSQVGFEALIWGKDVHCFGLPFYAGWGLTNDRIVTPERRQNASLEQLVFAALVRYPVYICPDMNAPCEVETIMDHIGLQRAMRSRFPKDVVALGFSRWKRPILRHFLEGSTVKFIRYEWQLKDGDTIVLWGNRKLKTARKHISILRVEDGFLRSSGLGADLTWPFSWVIDSDGIYYNPETPCGLQNILETHEFHSDLIDRARNLRETILAAGLSKYNLAGNRWKQAKTDRTIILVPGQVEDDASITAGCLDVKTNLMLLRQVRKTYPDAYIVFKPHPDVLAGLRESRQSSSVFSLLCDEIVLDVDIADMLEKVDEVHTMTSLTGFEALLRGIPVFCYGVPFYAGWGLTQDANELPGRNRLLELDELVAATLILYPTYINHYKGGFISPESAAQKLIKSRKNGFDKPAVKGRLTRLFTRFRRSISTTRKPFRIGSS